jgi:hypothetical protein
MFVLVYVDDIIIVSSSSSATALLLWDLEKDSPLKDLGPLHFFLGIEVTPIHDDILLSQCKYAAELLHKAGMVACKYVLTPLSTLEKLSSHSGDVLDPQDATHYRSIVGGLQYLILTRPDIVFAGNKVYQYLHCLLLFISWLWREFSFCPRHYWPWSSHHSVFVYACQWLFGCWFGRVPQQSLISWWLCHISWI